MKIIVGLGNPGDNYSLTKHNFGFWVIDKLVKQSSLKYKAGKGDYVYAKNGEYMFVKPTTYVNNSGIAINQILNYYDTLTSDDIIVIYDDIDIDLGTIKFKSQGSAGGHNGIKSIIYHIKTDVFKQQMWYAYDKEDGAGSSLVSLNPDRVREIIRLNKAGDKPNDLSEFIEQVTIEEPDYTNVVGQDSLNRFDSAFKKNKKRRPKNKQNKRRGRNNKANRGNDTKNK